MTDQDVSQQAALAGDAEQGNPETITTGDFTSVEVSNTAESQVITEESSQEESESSDKSNKEAAVARRSDKEWQHNKEKAQKFDKLVDAITDGGEKKLDKNVDPIDATLSRINDLENKLERTEWEGKNLPRDISEEELSTWKEACERKASPEDPWSRLSFEELWKLSEPVKRDSAPLTQEVKEKVDMDIRTNNSNGIMGSVSVKGTPPISGDNLSDLDRKIAAQMGWSEDDYKSAGVEL